MHKYILPFLFTPCLSLISLNATALTCNDNPAENLVSANNYIFQILDYIDLPTKGIKQEIRTIATKLDKGNSISSTAKHTLDYDSNGLITQSQYELFSNENQRVYSEHLQKTNVGWENIIEDVEDRTNSIIQFKTDSQGKIVESQQAKKAVDFIFIETDSYQYDANNCLISKNVQWKVKGVDEKGKFTGVDQNGGSSYTFAYQQQQVAKVLYQFSNNMKNENDFLYQFDNNHRLSSIQTSYWSSGKNVANYMTHFLTFNDKNDWLTASKVKVDQSDKQTQISRQISYY